MYPSIILSAWLYAYYYFYCFNKIISLKNWKHCVISTKKAKARQKQKQNNKKPRNLVTKLCCFRCNTIRASPILFACPSCIHSTIQKFEHVILFIISLLLNIDTEYARWKPQQSQLGIILSTIRFDKELVLERIGDPLIYFSNKYRSFVLNKGIAACFV